MDVGIVGLGGQGRLIASACLRLPEARVAGVFDPDRARAERFLDEQRGISIRNARSLTELLEDETLDCVCICSPPVAHPEQVEASLAAGKHVFVEKPLAADWEGAECIAEAVCRHPQLHCLVGSAYLTFLPAVKVAQSWLADGCLGQLHGGRITYRLRHRPAGWFLHPEVSGGGVWIDLAYHPFSVLWFLLPQLRAFRLSAASMGAWEPSSRVEDWAHLLLWCEPQDCPFLVEVAWGAARAEAELLVRGAEGELRVDLLQNEAERRGEMTGKRYPEELTEVPDLAMHQMEYFARCIEQNVPPQVGSVSVAMRIHALIMAAYQQAVWHGKGP